MEPARTALAEMVTRCVARWAGELPATGAVSLRTVHTRQWFTDDELEELKSAEFAPAGPGLPWYTAPAPGGKAAGGTTAEAGEESRAKRSKGR